MSNIKLLTYSLSKVFIRCRCISCYRSSNSLKIANKFHHVKLKKKKINYKKKSNDTQMLTSLNNRTQQAAVLPVDVTSKPPFNKTTILCIFLRALLKEVMVSFQLLW